MFSHSQGLPRGLKQTDRPGGRSIAAGFNVFPGRPRFHHEPHPPLPFPGHVAGFGVSRIKVQRLSLVGPLFGAIVTGHGAEVTTGERRVGDDECGSRRSATAVAVALSWHVFGKGVEGFAVFAGQHAAGFNGGVRVNGAAKKQGAE